MALTPQEFRDRLHGVIAFAPTPFYDDGSLDLDGLAGNIDALCRADLGTVVVCGGVGEFFALDDAEYVQVVETAVAAAARRALVVAGVGHSTRQACRLAAAAARAGADGLMVNPTYFVQPSEAGWYAHYAALASASGLGLMVFSAAGAVCSASTLERLAEIPEVVAFKDENGDLKVFGELVERLGRRFAWINGTAEVLAGPYAAAGAVGMTSGIVNIAPSLSQAVWDAAIAGRWDDLRGLIAKDVRPLARLRERRPGYPIVVIKEALNLLGRPGGGAPRLPLLPLAAEDRADLKLVLARMGLLAPAAAGR